MNMYFLEIINNQISVSEYENDEFILMRNKGEESWEYQDFSFWDWFKRKIEYEDEELSFVVLCDDDFEIDKSIKLSQKHFLPQAKIEDIYYDKDLSNIDILSYPSQYKSKDIKDSIQNKKIRIKKEQEEKERLDKEEEERKLKAKKEADLKAKKEKEEKIKQKKLKEQEEQKIKSFRKIKDSYELDLKNTIENFKSKHLHHVAKEIALQTSRFAVLYAYNNDIEDAKVQAKTNDEFVIKKDTFSGLLGGSTSHISKVLTSSTSNKEDEKIDIKLDSDISIPEQADIKKVISETQNFIQDRFAQLSVPYKQLQQNIDNINSAYAKSLIALAGQKGYPSLQKLSDEDLFSKGFVFSNDIFEIQKSKTKLYSCTPFLQSIGAEPSHHEVDLTVLSPSKIIELVKTNVATVDKKLVSSQRKIQTAIGRIYTN